MKIKPLLLLVALVLAMSPTLVSARGAGGAPAMPLVVCHVGKAPQMLVPEYVCKLYGGSQHY